MVSIGPVQGFVAQARRTRDLWAGSFLLSWLTGKAMAAVTAAGGRILVPAVDRDPLFLAITGVPSGLAAAPFIGSLPNQFSADLPEGVDPAICRKAVQDAWCGLGQAVRDTFVTDAVATAAKGGRPALDALWDRQMAGFWEVIWVAGPQLPPAETGHWLAMRKNWRAHLRSGPTGADGGDNCLLMGDWPELSGWLRSVRSERAKQDAFWAALRRAVREKPTDVDTLELAEGERLSAIALVKRLFPVLPEPVLKRAIGWVPGGSRDRLRSWPSTRYMAALPWMQRLQADQAGKALARTYADEIGRETELAGYRVAERHASRHLGLPEQAGFMALDGNLFFDAALANPREFKVSDVTRKKLRTRLAKLIDEGGIGAPSPYYAVLLMDGDNVGALIRSAGVDPVTALFSGFTAQVDTRVRAARGATIYAGGDDVMALLPLPDAIACARDLQRAYRDAAHKAAAASGLAPTAAAAFVAAATISAGIVFAEAAVPLRLVLERARTLLKDLAKTANGRNSLALAILKPGGKDREWVSAWDGPAVDALVRMVDGMVNPREVRVSSGFIHALAGPFGTMLAGLHAADDLPDFDDDRLLDLLIETFRGDPSTRTLSEAQLRTVMVDYRNLCRRMRGDGGKTAAFDPGAGLVLRFLAENMPAATKPEPEQGPEPEQRPEPEQKSETGEAKDG
ncbi:type III-B CRISPR-associated protein Cas10/Cmr2 [Tistrella mobilis]|nr:type III-B CRISPR-associated protein Cas10/Cmr2 [Tistrella mobilis]